MRIWIVNHYANYSFNLTGGTRHFNLAKELVKRGHEVCIIAANFAHFSGEYIATPTCVTKRPELVDGVAFCWIPVPRYFGNSIKRLFNIIFFSWRILRKKYLPNMIKPDVIIGSSPHLFAPFAASLLAKRYKVPFVFEVRDIWPETLILLGQMSNRNPIIIVMSLIEKYLYKKSDLILTLLPNSHDHMIANGAQANKIYWLPNFVDLRSFPVNQSGLNVAGSKYITFMYAGTHGFANNLNIVLEAAALIQKDNIWLDKIRIVLIGDGPEKKALLKLATEKNLEIVTFLPQVSRTKIYEILQQADAFLMLLKPSPVFRWGISPNKLFDYMLVGRPVVFGVTASNNPVAAAEAGITMNPDSPEDLVKAMISIASMSVDERALMGKRAREYVIKNHNIDNIANNLETVLIGFCKR